MNIIDSDLVSSQPIIIFSEGISYAHIARSLIIAQWLKQLSHPIVVACTEASSSLFSAEGLETVTIETADPMAIYWRLRQGSMMYETEDLLKYFKQDDRLIQHIQPRLIVSEFRFTALQLAKKYGIPSVGITEATCHPNFVPDGSVPDPFAKPRFLPLWLLDFISKRTKIGEKINQQTIENISISLREASKAYGLEPLPTFFDYASQGDICLLCDHPELIPIEPLRPGDIYTGALLWQRPEPLPAELFRLDSNKKTVYICPGTQESLLTSFLESYVKKLLKHGLQIIVSRGKRSLELTVAHENFFIFDFVNENKLLPKVDLIVYPGGAMTTYQALSCGVPLITLPAHANQHFYSEAIARNKLGCFFRPSRLKIDTLVRATLRLLKDSVSEASTKEFQKKLASFEGRETILSRVETLISGA
ncbi:MAG: glycosyltransferase [Xenococcaceae cyanobacterium MO_234.B1]|nr:glycosyltransferase [Xenococcaceae cyanobacterium MO_234.B1]